MLILTRKLAETVERKRCGVLPYTVHNGNVYFLCAIDRKTGDYCDFGGGVKRTETPLEGGIREFREESMCIFNEELYNANTYINTVAIDNQRREMSIIFLPLHERWFDVCIKLFDEANSKDSEVSSIEWLNEERFFEVTLNRTIKQGRRMWLRLKSFFMSTIRTEAKYKETIELLYKLYMHKYMLT